jgi:hypothetical protein
MKKILFVSAFALLLSYSSSISAQGTPPPPPPTGPSSGDHAIGAGGNAPIGGGSFILLGLGLIYAWRKQRGLIQNEQLE